MALGLHGSARTTPRIRAELQASQASTRSLARRCGLNEKTGAKWRRRTSTLDAPPWAEESVQRQTQRGRRSGGRGVAQAHAAAAR